jgi:hypothetical protein
MPNARNRILCVEDDRDNAALIAEELVDRGFEVSIACNGEVSIFLSTTPESSFTPRPLLCEEDRRCFGRARSAYITGNSCRSA